METRSLLDEALGLQHLTGRVLLLEDCVETSAAFVLHHLLKRSLSQPLHSSNVVVFVAFAQPFSHYDRILRKLGCNLAAHRNDNKFVFFDMLRDFCPDGDNGKGNDGGLVSLYGKILKTISALPQENKNCVTVMIDDVSLMEVSAKGSTNLVLDFLHYCHTLISEFGCSLVMLNHEDIYSGMGRPTLILQMEYLADILIKAEPLATGLASDVHGQLTVVNRSIDDGERSRNKLCNFHFKVKENNVEYFYPGSRT
ncbi:putative elongation complex protein [Rosa chinensis]|uniref:Putative elongation complex protein n=2 Tax=Rosa chinensis TaxID=74649 RepID=A0A2P6SJS5_ROSCH|nr:elongator complex protein 6 isoform X1 [Rosa chinensis]PRQ58913.1 putative elongation complex protein [Rosa chinensis]